MINTFCKSELMYAKSLKSKGILESQKLKFLKTFGTERVHTEIMYTICIQNLAAIVLLFL